MLPEAVNNLINHLTNDDDIRQDLWVCYLDGKPLDELDACLVKAEAEYQEDIQLQYAIWSLIYNPLSNQLISLIEHKFTEYERSIICYLMLGLDAKKISELKGISEVRIRQSIATIRYNNLWSSLK